MSTILTKSNKTGRQVETNCPDILEASSLQEIVNIMGEEQVLSKVKAQLTVDFRAKVRGLLESQTDDEPTYDVAAIQEMDFSDWSPEARQRKSAEEKAAEILGKLTPDQIKAALAMAEDK